MPNKTDKRIYTAKSQFWVGESMYRPIDQGGRAIEEGDPILERLADRFEVYQPRVRDYPGRVEQATAAPGEKRR
jgi:hypothetical protein